ncbi:hypothetical protein H0H87_005158, partial [Tephrocybe sp. NHM501043]
PLFSDPELLLAFYPFPDLSLRSSDFQYLFSDPELLFSDLELLWAFHPSPDLFSSLSNFDFLASILSPCFYPSPDLFLRPSVSQLLLAFYPLPDLFLRSFDSNGSTFNSNT